MVHLVSLSTLSLQPSPVTIIWKKASLSMSLPYWKYLHCLTVTCLQVSMPCMPFQPVGNLSRGAAPPVSRYHQSLMFCFLGYTGCLRCPLTSSWLCSATRAWWLTVHAFHFGERSPPPPDDVFLLGTPEKRTHSAVVGGLLPNKPLLSNSY